MPDQEARNPGEVTRLLREVRSGNGAALERMVRLIYDDLRALARNQLRREYEARTLEPTGLVHEALLNMIGDTSVTAVDRAHFLSLAANAMRQVLVDHARRRTVAEREDAWQHVTLTEGSGGAGRSGLDAKDLLALDDALERLDVRQRRIVECRFFAGMDDSEIAAALGVTDRTVRREWVKARARLDRELYD